MLEKKKNLVWIDLEMTGLDPKKDKIIEIASLVTNSNLEILEEGPSIVIFQSDSQLSKMNEWNKHIHSINGLIQEVKHSKIEEEEAEKMTIDFLKKWTIYKKSPICGSSIWKDRHFLFNYMPNLESYLHYRCIDVSTIRELSSRWNKNLIFQRKKQEKQHRAMNDIRNSIKELIFYRKNFFLLKNSI
ncbi:oligoribonuclease [bacterium endosymbiont of Pedicinus badii]|uniref:oligoribonuclease n=1 Tax=bacterium endosymbiont of Pedicinus badii TaxID=1719126 RepID=UPI0009B9E805|nr:oligoribonuclease [bacterium endosymbiont of Pedicinus badii]OQM34175.1 oligoribonuclease [bacterium endosymbiont of Pedicinus badii]